MNPTPAVEDELLSGLYTDEEKAQILGQIEEAAAANRLPEVEGFRPRKRGILFPVLVNLAAIGIIAGAWWGAGTWYQTRQQALRLQTDELFSTESKLLAKVLQDSKKQLAEKDAEIETIRAELAQLASEKAELQKSFTARIQDRERALRQEMVAAVAAERQRLESTGLGAAEVAQRLREFEEKKNAEFSAKLAEYRRQVQQEIDQRNQAVAGLQARLEASVSAQEALRRTIETQTRERENQLRTQLNTQAADLAGMAKEREELQAFFATVDPFTAEVGAALRAQNDTRAQGALLGLRQALARASASGSDAVRQRALAATPLVEALGNALTTLEATVPRAGADAALEALRAESRRVKDLAALEVAEVQKTLAATQVQLREAEAEIAALRTSVDTSTNEAEGTRSQLQGALDRSEALAAQVAELQQTVAGLAPYRTQADALTALFVAPHPSVRDRFSTTLGSPEAQALLPGVAPAWDELQNLLRTEGGASSVRRQAFAEVLTLTSYLRGQSPTASADRQATEARARGDQDFRRVVEDIQDLAAGGAREASVDTSDTRLYGTVVSRTGGRLILEALTKVRPQVGDLMEVRHVEARRETVLGRGTVVSISDDTVVVEWTLETLPRSGDPAYVVLP